MTEYLEQRRRNERGMTLVEIMVVVVIISLVVGVVGVQVMGQLNRAKVSTARTQIRQISDALELYKLSYRNYPSTAEGLQALTSAKGGEEPIMSSVPEDPWGKAYVYIYPGTHNVGGFDLMSNGPDQVQGGSDDIGNWDSAPVK
ncbi:MAG: type II secretion system protein GspG [Deltaproteobacteria bacterium]|nr:MAG: type II secretion system protein GspG [Deltaproteobacteria bacterium]